jgi:hypothetical protein
MRGIRRFLLLAAAALRCGAAAQPAPSAPLTSAPAAPPAEDVVFRAGLPPQTGRVLGLDAQYLRFETRVMQNLPAATIALPRGQVQRIVFAERPEEARLFADPKPSDLAALRALWERKLPFLRVSNSDTGRAGLALAEVLLASADAGRRREALDLFRKIEGEDWNAERRALAGQGRLRAMVANGMAAEAVAEARELAEVSEDPAVLIEAKYVLGRAALETYSRLVADNPRWQEDPRVRPERDRIFHETLDLLLYPYLFHGTHEGPAARGLLDAAKLLAGAGEPGPARELALDLAALYPATPQAAEAGTLLASFPTKKKTP